MRCFPVYEMYETVPGFCDSGFVCPEDLGWRGVCRFLWFLLFAIASHRKKGDLNSSESWVITPKAHCNWWRIEKWRCNNAKWGLINPSRLINHHCPKKKCNLKTGGPPGLINRWAYPRLINHHFGNPFFYPTFFISNSIYFQLFFTFFLIIIVILQV